MSRFGVRKPAEATHATTSAVSTSMSRTLWVVIGGGDGSAPVVLGAVDEDIVVVPVLSFDRGGLTVVGSGSVPWFKPSPCSNVPDVASATGE